MSFNPVLLNNDESFLKWLNPEKLEITETEEKGSLTILSVSYPIDEVSEAKKLFKIGNKIWIPSVNGLKSCLYIINEVITDDYFNENKVTFDAEEILTELNYAIPFDQVNDMINPGGVTVKQVELSKSNTGLYWLNKWFGDYFTITLDDIDDCYGSQGRISPAGIMTKMELLRYIEEETGNIFVTRYEKEEGSNRILRYLEFRNPNGKNLGKTHESVIDLGYNCENIIFELDESETFRAIAPIISLEDSDNTSSLTALTREHLTTIIDEWMRLGVNKGATVPMKVEKTTSRPSGNAYPNDNYYSTVIGSSSEWNIATAYWAAPFKKESGKMYVEDDISTNAQYNNIRSKPDRETSLITPKIGTVSTSDTDPYAIFNDVCMKLIEKRYPSINVEVDVKDINTGGGSSYNVYDKLRVKVPDEEELIVCIISKTEKDAQDINGNKIVLENGVIGGKLVQQATTFLLNNHSNNTMTISSNGSISGTLQDSLTNILDDKLVSIKIDKPETTTTEIKKEVKKVGEEINKTSKVKNKNAITVTMKPSCAYHCGTPNKWYTKTWLNKCPFCGGKLKINPKHTSEGELTCSSSKCGADFCGVCGREKRKPFRKRLTKSSKYITKVATKTNTKNNTQIVETKVKKTEPAWTKIYKVKTNSNGGFSQSIKNICKKGIEYTVTVDYGGEVEYGPCSKSFKLVIT